MDKINDLKLKNLTNIPLIMTNSLISTAVRDKIFYILKEKHI